MTQQQAVEFHRDWKADSCLSARKCFWQWHYGLKQAYGRGFAVYRTNFTAPTARNFRFWCHQQKLLEAFLTSHKESLWSFKSQQEERELTTTVTRTVCSIDNNTTVGYVPREFGFLLWHSLTHGGEIEREVTGRWLHSALIQGRLKIPHYIRHTPWEVGSTSERHYSKRNKNCAELAGSVGKNG